MRDRIDDYLLFGVRYVWVIDPYRKKAWIHTADDNREVRDGLLRTENPQLIVPLVTVLGQST
jgi:Uma2 family endonuclease